MEIPFKLSLFFKPKEFLKAPDVNKWLFYIDKEGSLPLA